MSKHTPSGGESSPRFPCQDAVLAEPTGGLEPPTCCLQNSDEPLRRLPPRATFPATTRKIRPGFPRASPCFHWLVYIDVYIRVYTGAGGHGTDSANDPGEERA